MKKMLEATLRIIQHCLSCRVEIVLEIIQPVVGYTNCRVEIVLEIIQPVVGYTNLTPSPPSSSSLLPEIAS